MDKQGTIEQMLEAMLIIKEHGLRGVGLDAVTRAEQAPRLAIFVERPSAPFGEQLLDLVEKARGECAEPGAVFHRLRSPLRAARWP